MKEKMNIRCCCCGKSMVGEIEIPDELPESIKDMIRENPQGYKGIYYICEDCPPKSYYDVWEG